MKFEVTAFTIFILGVVVSALYMLYSMVKSDQWLPIDAKITRLEVKENYNRFNSVDRSVVEYIIDLSYEYEVEGTEYIGTKIYAGVPNVFTHSAQLEQFQSDYKTGDRVVVYYDKNNHNNSALLQSNMPIGFVLFLVFGILGVGYAIYWGNQFISK